MRGTKPFQLITRDTSSANITSTYAELDSALNENCAAVVVAASVAMQLIIGIGASGAEVDLFAVTASTISTPPTPILIPKGVRVSVKSLTGGTISSGIVGITFLN